MMLNVKSAWFYRLKFKTGWKKRLFQVEADYPVGDASPHIANIGRMVEV
jgi:hypothetical protein